MRAACESCCKRTLRREAQEFLEKPFVGRQARLFEYPMSPAEKSLYDDVTQYLLEPGILAFQGSQRQLLLLSFHRLMASSTRALAASLEGVARGCAEARADADAGATRGRGAAARRLEDDDAGSDDPASSSRTSAPAPSRRPSRPSWPASKATSSAPARSAPRTASSARCCRRCALSVERRRRAAASWSSSPSRASRRTYLRERLIESRLVSRRRDHAVLRHQRGQRARRRRSPAGSRRVPQRRRADAATATSRCGWRWSTSSAPARACSSPPRPAPRA